jgi:hypothetical protein
LTHQSVPKGGDSKNNKPQKGAVGITATKSKVIELVDDLDDLGLDSLSNSSLSDSDSGPEITEKDDLIYR